MLARNLLTLLGSFGGILLSPGDSWIVLFYQNVQIFLLVQNRVISNNTLSTFLRLVKVAQDEFLFFFKALVK